MILVRLALCESSNIYFLSKPDIDSREARRSGVSLIFRNESAFRKAP